MKLSIRWLLALLLLSLQFTIAEAVNAQTYGYTFQKAGGYLVSNNVYQTASQAASSAVGACSYRGGGRYSIWHSRYYYSSNEFRTNDWTQYFDSSCSEPDGGPRTTLQQGYASGNQLCSTDYFDPETGLCTTPPPPPPVCNAGERKSTQNNDPGQAFAPYQPVISVDSCECAVDTFVSEAFGWASSCVLTGEPEAGTEAVGMPVVEGEDAVCVSGDLGSTICFPAPESGSSAPDPTVDGDPLPAADRPYSGTCTQLPGGSFVCSSDAINTPKDPVGNPKPTDFSTKADRDGDGTPETYDHYPLAPQESTSVQVDVEFPCMPGDPSCKAHIDESGTPTDASGQFDGVVDGTGIQGLIDGIGDSSGVAGTDIGDDFILPAMPGASACQSITMDVLGYQWVFPSGSQCTWLLRLKEIIGWVLYVLTAFALFDIATRRPA